MYTKTTRIALINRLSIFATLLSVAIIAPILGGHQQWITGPIVNATLFLAVMFGGTSDALLIGIFPSTVALGVGLLPPILAPLIPLIIVSNSILVTVYNALRRLNEPAAIITASFAKYAFLAVTSTFIARLLLNQQAAAAALKMLTGMQFATALFGGLIALLIYKGITRNED